MNDLLHQILQGAGVVLAGAISAFLVQLARKYGVDLTDAQTAAVKAVVKDGIALAAEKVAAGGATSQQKLEIATAHVVANTSLSPDEAKAQIHATLASVGEGATVTDIAPIDPLRSTPAK